MNRYEIANLNPGLREVLNLRNADDLKKTLALPSTPSAMECPAFKVIGD